MQRPLLIGHRGARGLFPENTIEGIAAALMLGVDGVEFDVAITADGVPVLSHDPGLNPDLVRGSDGAWLTAQGPLIRSLTVAQLAAYDFGRARPGGAVALANPQQQPRDGARIPALAQVLGQIDTHFIIEMKTLPDHPDWTVPAAEMAERVAAVVDRRGAAARVTIESFDWRGPRHLRRTRPDLRFAWLTRAETTAAAKLWWDGPVPADFGDSVPRAVAAEGGPVWAPEHVDLTPDLVTEAHELGLLVLPWTVNRADDMARLIGWGVDGLISDRPDIGRSVIGVGA
ncbi:MAG TPA: glycerophosphodiester phosphodiesterase family protein [Acetobacteraceae bacterium]|nr:glycerophosphodiester phosphodiesterase family protein [Acetobacteraceae bacterium]